jgi:hypothetical protein
LRLPATGILLAAFVVPVLGVQGQPFSATPPAIAADLEGSRVSGEPSQLAWSPDSTTLCLQTTEGDRPPLKTRYYLIRAGERDVKSLDAPPEWAPKYWDFKSARTAPGRPGMVIQVESKKMAGSIPSESLGDKAANRGRDNLVAAQEEANGPVVRTLTLKGEAIGQFTGGQPLVPGTTFGWSPAPQHAVAYARPDGQLGLMDLEGGKMEVAATKGVTLPAWSPDGSKIVYVQKQGRHHYVVMQVTVTRQ